MKLMNVSINIKSPLCPSKTNQHLRRRPLVSYLLSLVIFSSCAGTMQTARTNGEGNWQTGIEIEASALIDTKNRSALEGVLPSPNLAIRYGVSDTFDIGARVGPFRAALQSKLMLTDPNDYENTAISFAPSANIFGVWLSDSSSKAPTMISFELPLLFGVPLGKHELVLSPKISSNIRFTGRENKDGILLVGGTSAGIALRLGDTFWLLPEIAVELPFFDKTWEGPTKVGIEGAIITAGVGFIFGGRPAPNSTNLNKSQ